MVLFFYLNHKLFGCVSKDNREKRCFNFLFVNCFCSFPVLLVRIEMIDILSLIFNKFSQFP